MSLLPPYVGIWWHGSPSGDLRGGRSGLHVGTYEAARQALTARIGHPVEGTWDGTREYGRTLLAGRRTLAARDIFVTGVNCRAPENDYHPTPENMEACFSDGTRVLPTHRPVLLPVRIIGPMSNTPGTPMQDFAAGGRMAGMLKRGIARRGYYYRNAGEDAGSISAVLPGPAFVEVVPGVPPP